MKIQNHTIPNNSNGYFLNDIEYAKMQKIGSKTIKMEGNNGIGVVIHCLDKYGNWIDITDYDKW